MLIEPCPLLSGGGAVVEPPPPHASSQHALGAEVWRRVITAPLAE